MKKIAILGIVCAVFFSCNNNDTSHAGVRDSTKVSVDSPKAVITDSSKLNVDSAPARKDTAH